MSTINQCSLYTDRMEASSLSCLVPLLIITVGTSLASPWEPRDFPTAELLVWKEKVADYPEKEAEAHIAQLEMQNKTQYFLSSEKIKELYNRTTRNKQNEIKNLCGSEIKRRIPQGVEINGDEFYVLNPDSRPIQYFETEECKTTAIGKPCNYVEDTENTYRNGCKQEYITRELYLMDKNNPRELQVKLIYIESCCSCFVFIN